MYSQESQLYLNCDFRLITTEYRDVILHPLEGKFLIQET